MGRAERSLALYIAAAELGVEGCCQLEEQLAVDLGRLD
jgi:hypothetical protein